MVSNPSPNTPSLPSAGVLGFCSFLRIALLPLKTFLFLCFSFFSAQRKLFHCRRLRFELGPFDPLPFFFSPPNSLLSSQGSLASNLDFPSFFPPLYPPKDRPCLPKRQLSPSNGAFPCSVLPLIGWLASPRLSPKRPFSSNFLFFDYGSTMDDGEFQAWVPIVPLFFTTSLANSLPLRLARLAPPSTSHPPPYPPIFSSDHDSLSFF